MIAEAARGGIEHQRMLYVSAAIWTVHANREPDCYMLVNSTHLRLFDSSDSFLL